MDRMTRAHSHEGFWALLRAALRLLPKGFRLNNLSMEHWNQRIRLADFPWRLSKAIYVSELMKRRVAYVFLDPLRPNRDARRRRQVERQLDSGFGAHGYRPRDHQSKEGRLAYERALDGKHDPVRAWVRLLGFADPVAGNVRAGTVPGALRALIRRGWTPSGLSLHGPTLKFSGGGRRWTVRSYVFWAKKEGTQLLVDLWAVKKIPRKELERDSEARRFVDGVVREFKKQRIVDPDEYRSKRWGYPRFFVGLNFSRRRIPRNRLLQALDRLRDWKPME